MATRNTLVIAPVKHIGNNSKDSEHNGLVPVSSSTTNFAYIMDIIRSFLEAVVVYFATLMAACTVTSI